jgi:hypothetical protein
MARGRGAAQGLGFTEEELQETLEAVEREDLAGADGPRAAAARIVEGVYYAVGPLARAACNPTLRSSRLGAPGAQVVARLAEAQGLSDDQAS